MKNHSSIRKPSLAHSNVRKNKEKVLSVGDTLRKAKSDLFFRRCFLGIVCVLLITGIVYGVVNGYADGLIDRFYDMMG